MSVTPNILTLYYNRGARVKCHLKESPGFVLGTIECERKDRPGHYYVRRIDHGTLMSVLWLDMELAP